MTSRRQYAGGASTQTLTADLTSVATTATLSASTAWPDGSVGPFAVVVGLGTNSEEKMLCSSLSGNTLTIQTRGYDGTGQVAHTAGDNVQVCATAIDLDEANAHTSAVAGVHGVNGNVVGTTDIQTLANKTLVSPIQSDQTNSNHDHSSTSQGGPISTANFMHSGTATYTGASTTFAQFPHGAGYTPTSAAVWISATNAGGNYDAHVYGLDGTNITVAWTVQGSAAGTNLTSCTIKFTVFA